MDKDKLQQAIKSLLNRIPPSIASASINDVRDFKAWHSRTLKQMNKLTTPQLQILYQDVLRKYSHTGAKS